MDALFYTPFSTLTRKQSRVLREVAVRDVMLERRDGPNLMLVDANRELNMRGAVGTIAQMVALLPGDAWSDYADQVAERIPWIRALPHDDRVQLVGEFVEQAQRCSELGDFAPLGGVLHQWRNTALIYENPEIRALLDAEPDTDIPVARPAA